MKSIKITHSTRDAFGMENRCSALRVYTFCLRALHGLMKARPRHPDPMRGYGWGAEAKGKGWTRMQSVGNGQHNSTRKEEEKATSGRSKCRGNLWVPLQFVYNKLARWLQLGLIFKALGKIFLNEKQDYLLSKNLYQILNLSLPSYTHRSHIF